MELKEIVCEWCLCEFDFEIDSDNCIVCPYCRKVTKDISNDDIVYHNWSEW